MNGRSPGSCTPDWLVAAAICLTAEAGFALTSDRCLHWFALPVGIAGWLTCVDVVRCIRGRYDFFDPIALVGVAAFYSMFVGPFLHVTLDYWMPYVVPPADWRPWLGTVAVINCGGLLLYRAILHRYRPRRGQPGAMQHWRFDSRFFLLLALFLAASAMLQAYVYFRMGGVEGYADAYMTAVTTGGAMLQNMGWLIAISESLPTLAFIGFCALVRKKRLPNSRVLLGAALCGLVPLQLLFGGFRGSRGNTIWVLLWALGIVHLWVRKLPRWAFLVGAVLFVAFMHVFSFYKEAGLGALQAIEGSDAREVLSKKTRRTLEGVLLGDLQRSDVQAFALYTLLSPGRDYDYAYGRTYLGALALLIPRDLWEGRPPAKVKWTSDLEHGKGSSAYGTHDSTRIYGLVGESMLNFGPLFAPIAFVALAAAVLAVQKMKASLRADDTRMPFVPFLSVGCVLLLNFDSDNILWYLVKHGGMAFLLILAGSRRLSRRRGDRRALWAPAAQPAALPANASPEVGEVAIPQ